MPELRNPRQELFCHEYIVDLNATQAAVRAGYAPRTAGLSGYRLIKNDNIRARVNELLDELKSQKIADATEVLEYLTAVIRGEKQEEVVTFNPMGDMVLVQKAIGGREQIKAAELLAKRYGLLTDNVKLSGAPVQIIDDMKSKYGDKSV